MIFKAISFATEKHQGQFRKGGKIPYIIHPIGVAKILINARCSSDHAVAGVLHDVVEDTDTTFDEIEKLFNENIAELVKAASEKDKTKTWKERKIITIEELNMADPEYLFVPCADKIDNLLMLIEQLDIHGDEYWKKFHAEKKEMEWYYKSMAEICKNKLINTVMEENSKKLVEITEKIFK